MQLWFLLAFAAWMVTAPWISRKWGKYGEIAWGIISMLILMLALLFLE